MKSARVYTEYSRSGFTLIELLVVIAIIGILSVIGLTLFSNVQQNARDARRKSDIGAIAKALEVNKTQNTNTYNSLTAAQFSGGAIPNDTTTAKYCIAYNTTTTAPLSPTAWATTAECPTLPTGLNYASVTTAATPPNTTVSWKVCALLEVGANPTTYCLSNSQ